MDQQYITPETNKHNAIIAYCFLAGFMLLSRNERFTHTFVRSHAKYAAIIHVSFLALIVALVRSRNFSSVILFDLTWVNGILYVAFFLLLMLLMLGISRAMHGQEPKFSLSIKMDTTAVESEYEKIWENQKMPIILSHIPFFGRYFRYKYWNTFKAWEKWGNWVFIIGCILSWIDPSMTLSLFWLLAATIWLVYQSVVLYTDSTIHLIGEKLPGSNEIHRCMKSIVLFVGHIFGHEKWFPTWSETYEKSQTTPAIDIPKPEISSATWSIPILNIYLIYRVCHTTPLWSTALQCLFLSLWVIAAYLIGSLPLFFLIVLLSWETFFTLKNQTNLDIPIISEISDMIVKALQWKKQKSITKDVSYKI